MAAQLSHAIAAYQPRPRTTTMPAAAWTTATTVDSLFTKAASISPPPIIRTRPATIPTGHCTNSIFTSRRRVPADGEKSKRFTTENRFSLCNDCNRLKLRYRLSYRHRTNCRLQIDDFKAERACARTKIDNVVAALVSSAEPGTGTRRGERLYSDPLTPAENPNRRARR